MGRVEAVIFDFDGTLAELTIDFSLMRKQVTALAEAFLEEAPSAQPATALEQIEFLAERIERRSAGRGREFASRCRLLVTALEMDAAAKGRLFPGSLGLLDQLQARGFKLGIITRNCSAAVTRVFPEVRRHCQVFLAREDVPLVKPHPDHLLRAAASLGVKPAGCLMIGDHVMDIQVAKQAGTFSAGVASGKASRSELAAADPDFVFDQAEELLSVLDSGRLLR